MACLLFFAYQKITGCQWKRCFWRWNDETTGTILVRYGVLQAKQTRITAVCGCRSDASAGHSRHYAVSGAAVAAGKCAAESGPGRGTADPDCRFSGVGPRYRENHAGLCRPDHEPCCRRQNSGWRRIPSSAGTSGKRNFPTMRWPGRRSCGSWAARKGWPRSWGHTTASRRRQIMFWTSWRDGVYRNELLVQRTENISGGAAGRNCSITPCRKAAFLT